MIWTLIVESIFFDNNYYTTLTFNEKFLLLPKQKYYSFGEMNDITPFQINI